LCAIERVVDVALLLVVVEFVVEVDLNAFEAVVHDEVDHARDGVGTVDRGGAAGSALRRA